MTGPFPALIMTVLSTAGGCQMYEADRSGPANVATGIVSRLLADFEGEHPREDTHSGLWRAVNDNIMGGRSIGAGLIQEGAMIFSGSTNTNGGGFASIRAGEKRWDLRAFDGLAARIRADGRKYVFHLQTGLLYDGSEVAYRGSFDTAMLLADDGGEPAEDLAWEEVFVPFANFVPMVRGRDISGRIRALDTENITSVGFMIDDGLDGPFRLEVDWLKAVSLGMGTDE